MAGDQPWRASARIAYSESQDRSQAQPGSSLLRALDPSELSPL